MESASGFENPGAVVNALVFEDISCILENMNIFRPKILLDECVDHKFWYNRLRNEFDKEICGIQHVCKLSINGSKDSEVVEYAYKNGYEVIMTSDKNDFPSESSIKSRYPEIRKKIYIEPVRKRYLEEYAEEVIIPFLEEFIDERNSVIKNELVKILG
ncbi:MAG: DUF5615 family PIN-like protein [Candidatus Nanoarchaeia archaeon]|nr:DUF5615 family PIN-like protein [Candidatus Omnitrophota bacterium]MDD5417887.1 DUF5615 family PIN-like protein [Candidatus Nanoarchaeia archaeon]